MKSALTALLTICLCWGVGCSKNLSEFQETKARAILGDSGAQTRLALMYYYGLGVEKDFKQAAKWYRKSADQGWKVAQHNIGYMYANGQGVEQDFKEAVQWCRKAADQGFAKAQYKLGVMYDNGEGVLEDNVTAYAWWNIAAANGSKSAKDNKPKIAKNMIPEQIAKAEELLIEMVNKNPDLIKKKQN